MRHTNYWLRRNGPNRLSRRAFIGTMGVTGAGAGSMALVGCGDDDDGDPQTPTDDSGDNGTDDQPVATTPPGDVMHGGVARIPADAHFDPSRAIDPHRTPGGDFFGQFLNKLIKYTDPDTGEMEGDLAESWEIIDAQNFSFKLREDVYWEDTPLTNGRQLTSDDIRWHFERQGSGELTDGTVDPLFRHTDFYSLVSNIDTPDDFTFSFELSRPRGTTMTRLAAHPSHVPNREAIEHYEDELFVWRKEMLPASGPYKLVRLEAEEDIEMGRNQTYFEGGDAAILDGLIRVPLAADPNVLRIAFEQKQIDMFSAPDPALAQSILDGHPGETWEGLRGFPSTIGFYLNVHPGQQFEDERLVRAMHNSADRRMLIEAFHQGLGQQAGTVSWVQEGFAIPPEELNEMPGYRSDREEDVRDSRALWDAADGAALGEIRIGIREEFVQQWPDALQIIPAMWNEALGVDQFVGWTANIAADVLPGLLDHSGTYPHWFSTFGGAEGPDPRDQMFLRFHSTGGQNYLGLRNEEMDSLLEDAIQEPDLEEAIRKSRLAQRFHLENGQFGQIQLYAYIERSVGWNYYHPTWKTPPAGGGPGDHYNGSAEHLFYRNAWIDQNDPTFQGRPPATLSA